MPAGRMRCEALSWAFKHLPQSLMSLMFTRSKDRSAMTAGQEKEVPNITSRTAHRKSTQPVPNELIGTRTPSRTCRGEKGPAPSKGPPKRTDGGAGGPAAPSAATGIQRTHATAHQRAPAHVSTSACSHLRYTEPQCAETFICKQSVYGDRCENVHSPASSKICKTAAAKILKQKFIRKA